MASALGFSGAQLRVFSTSGQIGDRRYGLTIETTYRELPEDGGEDDDDAYQQTGQGGRLVDLATLPPAPNADPNLAVKPASMWEPEMRHLPLDWAWQHTAGDVDYYDVFVPPVDLPPPGHSACLFDRTGRLIVRAYGMRLDVPALDESGLSVVVIGGLNAKLPNGGHVLVEVRNPVPGKRGFYRFEADWENSRYYSQSECNTLREMERTWRATFPDRQAELLKGVIALQRGDLSGPPRPLPDPSPLELFALGGYRTVRLEQGDVLDTILSSTPDQPLIARLYDENGVLLGESVALEEAIQKRTLAPDGMIPHGRLTVGGLGNGPPPGRSTLNQLEDGRFYFLQIVPAFDVGKAGRVTVSMGVNEATVSECVACYDFDGDKQVDMDDVRGIAGRWRAAGDGFDSRYDLDGDRAITVRDIVLVIVQLGRTYP